MTTIVFSSKRISLLVLLGVIILSGIFVLPRSGDAGHSECGGGDCGITVSVSCDSCSGNATHTTRIRGSAWANGSYGGGFDMRLHCRTGPYDQRCTNASSCSTNCSYSSGGSYHIRNNSYIQGHSNSNAHKDSDGRFVNVSDPAPPPPPPPPAALNASLTATPNTGSWPLSVELTGTQTGVNKGQNTTWYFECDIADLIPGWDLGPYSSGVTNYSPPIIPDCVYGSPGTYTARAQASRNSIVRTVTTTISVTDPPPPDVSITSHNFCTGGASGTITWDYTSYYDPISPQASVQMQIATDSSFAIGTRIYDSGPATFFGGDPGTISISGIPPGKQLYARVMAWDSNSPQRVSLWSTTYSFRTPPRASFDLVPPNPVANASVSVTDTSNYGDAASLSWVWDMGDGTIFGPPGPLGAPTESHIYGVEGDWTVNLQVTDSFLQKCGTSQDITIAEPIPIIKEVGPQ